MMKKSFPFSLALMIFVCAYCGEKPKSLELPQIYKEYNETWVDERGAFVIGDDEDGRGPISDRLRYYSLPEHLRANSFADSLAQIYNMSLAFNSMVGDFNHAFRSIGQDGWDGTLYADAIAATNLDGISVSEARDSLRAITQVIAHALHNGDTPPDESYTPKSERYEEIFNSMVNGIILGRFGHVGAEIAEMIPTPADYIRDYDALHREAIADTTGVARTKILDRYLREDDFHKKCIYAREFAYADYRNPHGNVDDLMALLDPLLRGDDYSPLLRELWLIWRTAMQVEYLGGRGGYSSVYNLLYNDMRTLQAAKYIEHLALHPDDEEAFAEYLLLVYQKNVTRQDKGIFGNSVNVDEYNLYHRLLSK